MDCIGLETSFDCSGIQIWRGLETWILGLKTRLDGRFDWAILCHARDLVWAELIGTVERFGYFGDLVLLGIWLGWRFCWVEDFC